MSHHLLQTPKKTPTTPAMEKIDAVAIGASKEPSEEPLVPVPASAVASSEDAPAGLGQIPLGWDPYEEEEYIRPEKPL